MLFTDRIALLTGESHMDDKNLNNENESNEAKNCAFSAEEKRSMTKSR